MACGYFTLHNMYYTLVFLALGYFEAVRLDMNSDERWLQACS